jgi:chromosome segregation ATPase
MTQLNRELEKLESDIRAAVASGDEFLYSKLNRAKDELNQKIWFAESRQMKADIETLQTDRSFGLSVLADLNDESKQAANVVLEARSRLFDCEMAYQAIEAKKYYLTTQTEQQRKDIRDLQRKLDLSVDMKLNPDNYDEDGNLKKGEN